MRLRLLHPALALLIALAAPAVCRCAASPNTAAADSTSSRSHCHTPGSPPSSPHSHGADPCDCPAHTLSDLSVSDRPAAPLTADSPVLLIGLALPSPAFHAPAHVLSNESVAFDTPPPAPVSLHHLFALFLI